MISLTICSGPPKGATRYASGILDNCGTPGAITYGDNGLLAANSLAYVIGELYKRFCDECRASSTFSNATP